MSSRPKREALGSTNDGAQAKHGSGFSSMWESYSCAWSGHDAKQQMLLCPRLASDMERQQHIFIGQQAVQACRNRADFKDEDTTQ
jgi:hypothetical protein